MRPPRSLNPFALQSAGKSIFSAHLGPVFTFLHYFARKRDDKNLEPRKLRLPGCWGGCRGLRCLTTDNWSVVTRWRRQGVSTSLSSADTNKRLTAALLQKGKAEYRAAICTASTRRRRLPASVISIRRAPAIDLLPDYILKLVLTWRPLQPLKRFRPTLIWG